MIESQRDGDSVSKEFQTALGGSGGDADFGEASIKKTDTAKSAYDAATKN